MSDTLTPTTIPSRLDERCLSLLRYWDSLRSGRPVPGRVEISPAKISRHLSRISILERPRPGTIRVRLAGAMLSERMGMELRGMPFRSFFDLKDRARAVDAAEIAMMTPSISVLSIDRAGQFGTQNEGLLMILPLSDTRGAVTRAISLYSETATITPFVGDLRGRFGIADHWTVDIPEGRALPDLRGPGSARSFPSMTPTRVPSSAHTSSGAAMARVEARKMDHHTRPVFQVIDGGLA